MKGTTYVELCYSFLDCTEVAIVNCEVGMQECGGEPDGVRCTQCEEGYFSAGYDYGCQGNTNVC